MIDFYVERLVVTARRVDSVAARAEERRSFSFVQRLVVEALADRRLQNDHRDVSLYPGNASAGVNAVTNRVKRSTQDFLLIVVHSGETNGRNKIGERDGLLQEDQRDIENARFRSGHVWMENDFQGAVDGQRARFVCVLVVIRAEIYFYSFAFVRDVVLNIKKLILIRIYSPLPEISISDLLGIQIERIAQVILISDGIGSTKNVSIGNQ